MALGSFVLDYALFDHRCDPFQRYDRLSGILLEVNQMVFQLVNSLGAFFRLTVLRVVSFEVCHIVFEPREELTDAQHGENLPY